ncbi:MAG: DUF3147 family protein [Candidatus Dormiibacterota bacterium]
MSRSTRRHGQQRIEIDQRSLRTIKPRQYLVRFVFGFLVSAVATIITTLWGARVGGVFLAFPAILPASLTLIQAEYGRHEAAADAKGGQLGGMGLIAFGLVAWHLLPRLTPSLALVLATVAWCLVSTGAYLVLRRFFPAHWGHNRSTGVWPF